ncbi:molybdopterin oxidoreductase [Caballeronia sordidicola]|uniref:Molybdopterin oxidoreductase n=1 Tax=Caballeronia sordidicola TaxID=196367 RepID=A0A158I8X1_CABSO|nr:sulfite reductase flavoprotein subunit alpha [Caballeronia sordidicola]SAL52813.1 molybdopterin oxidoreductase [Caballeronia sordidicola]
MTRRILFQVHWLLGITVGLVLALMGLTGATMSFEDEITGLLNSRTISVANGGKGAERMTPDALLASIQAQFPGEDIRPLVLSADPARAAQFRVRQPSGAATYYADPYTGHVLGKAAGNDFFSFVEDLHRFLALPLTEGRRDNEIGKQITGVAAFSLIFFALSGLYLRWPRKPLDWRSWFVLDLKRTGRNLYRSLHAVIGAWMVLSYLLSALTGLWWSYGWYHDLVSKTLGIEEMRRAPAMDRKPKEALALAKGDAPRAAAPRKKRGAQGAAEPGHAISFDAAWNTFVQRVGPDFGRASLTVSRDGKSVSIERFDGPLRGGLMDRYTFDASTGSLKLTDLYADRPVSKVVGTSMLSVHSGSVFGIAGRVVIMLCSLTMPLFAITGWLLYLGRRRKRREAGAIAIPSLPPVVVNDVDSDLLIVHASQTGTAERIASMSAAAFASAGRSARLLPISALDSVSLAAARCVLFVVSTYGDGQAPDRARSFVRQMMARPAPSGGFSYGVLALGDREYPDFCHFGRQVDEWLTRAGARKLFERIEMNGRDDESEQRWRRQLSELGAATTASWAQAPVEAWTLATRELLNPGSQGGGVHFVRLKANAATAHQWTAGDIVEIYPRNDPAAVTRFLSAAGLDADTRVHGQRLDTHLSGAILPLPDAADKMSAAELVDILKPLPHRDYSIASVPADGYLDLVVRQLVKSSGELGVGSGWLTAYTTEGDAVQARIRTNAGFHRPEGERALILIGNGTGFAGLRAHLRERSLAGSKGHWLLFGERNARYDAFFKHELDAWRADGTLARVDLAYSRDDDCGRYVQDLIRQSASEIFMWVAGGAAIMVCGSLAGMAPAVDRELRAALGDERVSMMVANGLYRRDVY